MSTTVKEPTTSSLSIQDLMSQVGGDVMSKNLTRYVFLAGESLNIADRLLPVSTIQRATLTPIASLRHRARIENEEVLLDDPDTPIVRFGEKIKSAYECAHELTGSYGQRGLIVVDALTGQSEAAVADIQNLLVGEVPKTLPELEAILINAKAQNYPAQISPEFKALLGAVIDALLASVRQSTTYQMEQITIAEGELERRKLPGGVGRPGYTHTDLKYFETLGRTPNTRVLEELATQQREAIQTVQRLGTGSQQQMSENEHSFSDGRIPCVACAEPIQPAAKKCRFCGEWQEQVPPGAKEESKLASTNRKKKSDQPSE